MNTVQSEDEGDQTKTMWDPRKISHFSFFRKLSCVELAEIYPTFRTDYYTLTLSTPDPTFLPFDFIIIFSFSFSLSFAIHAQNRYRMSEKKEENWWSTYVSCCLQSARGIWSKKKLIIWDYRYSVIQMSKRRMWLTDFWRIFSLIAAFLSSFSLKYWVSVEVKMNIILLSFQ